MNMLAAIPSILAATALKATVLFLIAWSAALALRKLSAALRHMLLALAVSASLLLPFSAFLPQWHVRGIPDFMAKPEAASASVQSYAPPITQPSLAAKSSDSGISSEAANSLPHFPAANPPARRATPRAPRRHSQREAGQTRQPDVTIAPATRVDEGVTAARPPERHFGWPVFLAVVWIVGTVVFIIRSTSNRSRVRRLVRRAALLSDAGWNAQVRATAAAMGITRHVALLMSSETGIPLTMGTLYPAVVLPPECCAWSPQRREAVLNHELAHIKRLDAFTQLQAEIATALYWCNPLVWLIARAMRIYRERACDDTVLAAGTRASDYAHELLDIVSTLKGPELHSALAMARRSQLEGRILAVLNPAVRRGSVSRGAGMVAAGLTLAIVLPLAAIGPAHAQRANAPSTPTTRTSQGKPSPASRTATAAPAPPSANSSEDDQEIAGTAEPPSPPNSPEAAKAPEAPETAEPPSTPATFAYQSAPAAPGTPGAPAAPAAPSGPGGMELGPCGRVRMHSADIEDSDGRRTWKASWSGNNCDVSLNAEGDIRFNPEATAIQSISSGGYFEVNERMNDTLRQIRVTPGASGLEYVYKINGKQQSFDAQAQTWFSGFLLTLERTTGFNADARVAQLMAKGGPVAVLDEINNLQNDYVRSLYFRKLLEHPNLPAPIVLRIINQAAQQISGDYELARVLMTVGRQYDLADETSRTAFLSASNKLKNDYEHSRVLIELLRRSNISAASVQVALTSAARINNDYEKSRVALALIGQKSFTSNEVPVYLKLVSAIQSDYGKSRDLIAVLNGYQLPPSAVNQILDAAAGMKADYEKSRLLTSLAGKGRFDESQMTSYLKVVDSMKADYERSRSLMALINHNKLSNASLGSVFDNVAHIGNDYEKARVLTEVAGAYHLEGALRDRYIQAAQSIHSDFERNRALNAVARRASL